jgi:hypothetical protein
MSRRERKAASERSQELNSAANVYPSQCTDGIEEELYPEKIDNTNCFHWKSAYSPKLHVF